MAPAHGFGFLTRRRVLGMGLAGVSALVLGGGVASLLGGAPPVERLLVLNPREYRTMDAIAKTLIPSGGPFDVGAERFDLARSFDGYLAGEPDENSEKLRRALLLFELGPLLFERRATIFSKLSAAEREQHYLAWASSDVLLRRQVAIAFRKFTALVFYDRAEVWPHIGYPGPSLARLGK
ncbi:MAG: hypothetical protein IPI67_20455 [Myxococcales bacterium]|nr:hypothetical protein [Myxococcales bacterium]